MIHSMMKVRTEMKSVTYVGTPALICCTAAEARASCTAYSLRTVCALAKVVVMSPMVVPRLRTAFTMSGKLLLIPSRSEPIFSSVAGRLFRLSPMLEMD